MRCTTESRSDRRTALTHPHVIQSVADDVACAAHREAAEVVETASALAAVLALARVS
jgi:hypothetical protein